MDNKFNDIVMIQNLNFQNIGYIKGGKLMDLKGNVVATGITPRITFKAAIKLLTKISKDVDIERYIQ